MVEIRTLRIEVPRWNAGVETAAASLATHHLVLPKAAKVRTANPTTESR